MKDLSTTRRTMMTRSVTLAAVGALSAGASAAAVAPAAPAPATPYRAAFQVSDADPKKWSLTLGNVRNAQDALGAANITIEIVAFGPGIGMLKADSEVAARVQEAMQAGIGVFACQNTMHGMHLQPEDMIAKIGYVPAGVVELIKRQTEGWAYMRS
ncbi:DsrE family protein [Rugamonas sp.]|uniref:DsrE family protein n=1 Tax=Rugamonas sp. TaxID=1926287 RepID=UPI0025E17550|nr:DsrE family protein [Rugamonas sp.]